MPKETTKISCPSCGSDDVILDNGTIECRDCGAETPLEEAQYQFSEQVTEVLDDDGDLSTKVRIVSNFSEDDFVRKSWIALANEDAPLEVFDENFGEVIQSEREVVIDSVAVNVSYQVSVGYDRQEPYIAYETYYENEPYITTESYYDSTLKCTRTREVTKYRSVAKQRQVTKYKTVTDWSPLSGVHHASSVAAVEKPSV